MKLFKSIFNAIENIFGKTLDKFLKKLNVNRNTFFTYILTLISIYICVDRIVEMLLMIFTGISSNYWGPLKYTLALACPTFAFAFFGSSSFANNRGIKVTMFYVYMIGLYIITTYALTKLLIPVLRRLKFGQVVRTDGPETHLIKQGTPTMGGIVFIINFIIFMIIKFVTRKLNYGGDFLYRFGFIIISFGLIGLYDYLTKSTIV